MYVRWKPKVQERVTEGAHIGALPFWAEKQESSVAGLPENPYVRFVEPQEVCAGRKRYIWLGEFAFLHIPQPVPSPAAGCFPLRCFPLPPTPHCEGNIFLHNVQLDNFMWRIDLWELLLAWASRTVYGDGWNMYSVSPRPPSASPYLWLHFLWFQLFTVIQLWSEKLNRKF